MAKVHHLFSVEKKYSSFDRSEYTRCANRLRDITMALWKLQSQPSLYRRPLPQREKAKQRTIFHESIATLLTRTPDESLQILVAGIAERGKAPTGRDIPTVFVSQPKHTWDAEHLLDAPSRQSISTEGSRCSPRSCLHRIQKSRVDLAHPADRSVPSLHDYASNVLQGLSRLRISQNVDSSHERHLLHVFVLRRCWTQVYARFLAANSLLIIPGFHGIVEAISSWRIDPGDPCFSNLQHTASFSNVRPEAQIDTTAQNIQWRGVITAESLSSWTHSLCKTLEFLIDSVQKCDTTRNTATLNQVAVHMQTLDSIMSEGYIDHVERHCISFSTHLLRYLHPSHYFPVRHLRHISTPSDPQLDVPQLATINLDNIHGWPAEHLFRYLRSLTTWFNSIKFLETYNDCESFQGEDPSLDLVFHTVPTYDESCLVDPLYSNTTFNSGREGRVLSIEEEAVRGLFSHMEAQKIDVCTHVVEDHFTKLMQAPNCYEKEKDVQRLYHEALHSETLVMGLFVLQKELEDNNFDSGFDDEETYDEEVQTTSSFAYDRDNPPEDDCIGLASPRRWCFCCNFLYAFLYNPSDPSELSISTIITQRLWDFPGLLTPWIPPPIEYGIPFGVIQELEKNLFQLLKDGIREFLEPLTNAIEAPGRYGLHPDWELVLLKEDEPSKVIEFLREKRRQIIKVKYSPTPVVGGVEDINISHGGESTTEIVLDK